MIKKLIDNDTKRLFKKPLNEKSFATYPINAPNILHEIDVLYITNDDDYKYILSIIDVYNSLCGGRALKTLKMEDIIHAINDIYENSDLSFPICIQADNEFNNKYFKNWCNKNDIKLKITEPYQHRQNSHVERLNQTIGKWIWMIQTKNEIDTGKQNTSWRYIYRKIFDILNENTKKRNKLNNDFIREENKIKINTKKMTVSSKSPIIEIGTKVLLALDEPENIFGKKLHGEFRATDIRWKRHPVFKVVDYFLQDKQPVMYKIASLDGKIFNHLVPFEKLQII